MDEASYAALRRGLEPFHKLQTLWQGLILQRAPKDVAAGVMEASQTFCAFFGCPTFCNMSSGVFACLACVPGFTHAIASDCYGFGSGSFLLIYGQHKRD